MDDVVEVNGSPPPPSFTRLFPSWEEPGYVTRPMYACLCIMLYTHTCFQYQWVEAQSTSSKHVHHKKVFTHECHTPEHQIVNNSVKGRGETPLRRLYHRRVGMPGIQQLWFNISIWRWLQWRTKWTGALSKVELGENSQAGAWSRKPLCAYTHM